MKRPAGLPVAPAHEPMDPTQKYSYRNPGDEQEEQKGFDHGVGLTGAGGGGNDSSSFHRESASHVPVGRGWNPPGWGK